MADGPHQVSASDLFIPLADGVRLFARIWRSRDGGAVPAILEYLPYRLSDGTAARDALTHPYVAACGYACVRVDMRGSGNFDGLLLDEYLAQEQDDALEVIDWISRQPWCSGAVGMMGISWGGFNGLQVAARRPPALRAVISLCSTDDRYADDVHYMGGALLTNNLLWASTMLAYQSHPPDPGAVGERWLDMWRQRLEAKPLLLATWLRHQARDSYWRHGSVCEDPAAIAAACYLVGGWADAYSNAVPRMLQRLTCPRRGLIGPWAHKYPHFARPGPAYGFLQDAVAWWDHWLPHRAPVPDDADLPELPQPEAAPPLRRHVLREPETYRRVTRDQLGGRTVAEARDDSGRTVTETTGLEYELFSIDRFAVQPDDPLSAEGEVKQTAYDPDQARSLFKKAGVDGKIVLQASDAAFSGAVDLAQLFQANALRAGIPVGIKKEPADGYWDNVWLKGSFCTSYWGGRPAATQMLAVTRQSGAPWNETHWRVPQFDALLATARAELDGAKRRQAVFEMQAMLNHDGGMFIPAFRDWLDAHAVTVGGHTPHSGFDMDNGRICEKAWLNG